MNTLSWKVVPGPRLDQAIVQTHGDLDLTCASAFFSGVSTCIESGQTFVVIDCSDLEYLDSSGVGALIRLLQKVKIVRGEIAVAGLSKSPRKVLELCNVLSLLKDFPDVETAVRSWE